MSNKCFIRFLFNYAAMQEALKYQSSLTPEFRDAVSERIGKLVELCRSNHRQSDNVLQGKRYGGEAWQSNAPVVEVCDVEIPAVAAEALVKGRVSFKIDFKKEQDLSFSKLIEHWKGPELDAYRTSGEWVDITIDLK